MQQTPALNWHHADIVSALTKAGYMQVDVASVAEVALSNVNRTIRGEKKSPQAITAICKILGLEPSDIWPEWFAVGEWPILPKSKKAQAHPTKAALEPVTITKRSPSCYTTSEGG